jgi:membrane fusion protein (multidrug efflux system)
MRTQPAHSNNEGNALGTQDDAGRRQEPRQKHGILKTIIFTAGILAIGIGLVAWWLNSRKFEGTDDSYVAGHIHAMSFRISGTISEVLIDDNELVKVGQRIAKLDPCDFEVQLNQATAKLEIARAQLEK